ncbi:ATP synthase subunit b [Plasmodiophora brassicae]
MMRSAVYRAMARPRLPVAGAGFAPTGYRAMAAVANPAAPEPPSGFKAVVNKYGWLPFAAAAGSVALSKEILILNEEFLLVFTFSATVYALYKQLGGSVAKFFEERADRIRQELHTSLDTKAKLIDEEIQNAEAMLTVSDDIDAIYKQQAYLTERYLAAVPNKIRGQMANEILSRFNILAETERKFVSVAQDELAKAASEYVTKHFKAKGDAGVKGVIPLLTPGTAAQAKDPVEEQFVEYLKIVKKKVADIQGKEVTLDAKLKAKWRDALEELKRRDPSVADVKIETPEKLKLF